MCGDFWVDEFSGVEFTDDSFLPLASFPVASLPWTSFFLPLASFLLDVTQLLIDTSFFTELCVMKPRIRR